MITNHITKEVLSQQEITCKTIFSQARGLMFRRKQNLVMVFKEPQKVSLHMWCVFYPIDVVLLDEKMKVIETKHNFKPFTFWSSSKEAKYCLEFGKERIKNKVKINDTISIT